MSGVNETFVFKEDDIDLNVKNKYGKLKKIAISPILLS